MQIGVVFPQTEIGGDVGAVRAYARGRRGARLRAPARLRPRARRRPGGPPGWTGPYDVHTTFHEPFVLFGYLAAVTTLELVTGIIILPQRQTALVAKQAAEVDLLTGGRFRLGVGIGWNAVEYEALGKDFTDRGAPQRGADRALLRRLWTEPTVTFDGRVRARHRRRAGAAARCSGRSRSGSAPPRRRPTGASAGWPTAGSRWSRRAPRSTRRERSSTRRRSRPAATRRPSAWRAASAGAPAASTRLLDHVGGGATPARPTSSINTMSAGLAVDDHLAALAPPPTRSASRRASWCPAGRWSRRRRASRR